MASIARSSILTFHGVRGSMPVSGPDVGRYGGHTLCLDIDTGTRHRLIVDGGTGITALADSLTIPSDGLDFHVFLTHYHWDHIQGLPFFRPLLDDRNTFTFYGHHWQGQGVRELLEGALRPPWFPISITDTAATKHYVDVSEGPFSLGGLTISTAALRHPQGVTAYRFESGTSAVVLATDYERGDPAVDKRLQGFARSADVLIHDAQYTPEEYPDGHIGWGHSTRTHAAEAARQAEVERLVLVSHEPGRVDDEVDAIVAAARHDFPQTEAAYQGMQIRF